MNILGLYASIYLPFIIYVDLQCFVPGHGELLGKYVIGQNLSGTPS